MHYALHPQSKGMLQFKLHMVTTKSSTLVDLVELNRLKDSQNANRHM